MSDIVNKVLILLQNAFAAGADGFSIGKISTFIFNP